MSPPSPDTGARATGGLPAWRVRRLEIHIDRNLGERIAVTELAEVVRLSPGHFARACKETLGVSPAAIVVLRRLERAEVLMLTSNLALKEIALMCGFSDQAHFGNRFRQRYGASPSAWRRVHRLEGSAEGG